MLYLTLIRYAQASKGSSQSADKDRQLTARGLYDARKAGQYIARKNWSIEIMYCSNAMRTYQTTHLINETLKLPFELDERLYNFSRKGLIDYVRQLPDNKKSVAIIGHNPTLTHMYHYLTNRNTRAIPNCGIVRMGLDCKNWLNIKQGCAKIKSFHKI